MEALRASLEKTETAKATAAKLGPRKAPKRVEQAAKPARKASQAVDRSRCRSHEAPMQTYSVRDVERVLRLSRSTIRGLIDVGFVKPTRGPRREYRFSFQDLIVLRAARALIEAKVSRRRIRRSLEDLRRHLPETVPLSGLSICAVGDRVVVRDGKSHFQVDDGQYVLGLDVSVENGVLRVVEHRKRAEAPIGRRSAAEATRRTGSTTALELERTAIRDAAHRRVRARRRASIRENVAAWINWGRLLHEQRRDARGGERVSARARARAGRIRS